MTLCRGLKNHLFSIISQLFSSKRLDKFFPPPAIFFLLLLLPYLTVFWKIALEVQVHKVTTNKLELFLLDHVKSFLLLCFLYNGHDTIYRAPKRIYLLLLCVLYNGMIIIKQTECLHGWHNIIFLNAKLRSIGYTYLQVGHEGKSF